MAIIAGIDCGTQSTKVLCFDSKTKTVVAQSSYKHYEDSQNKLIECISSFKQSQKEITETLTEIVERLEKLDNRVCNIEGGKSIE